MNEPERRMRHHVVIPVVCAVLAFVVGLQPFSAWGDAPKVIRIGVAEIGLGGRQFSQSSALSVVHVQHLLETEFTPDGIAVEWHFYKGAGPAVTEALVDGQLDFALQGDLPSIIARSSGVKCHLLMASITRGNLYVAVPTASPAQKLSDLRGHVVVDFKGTALQLSAERLLASEGLSTSDFRLINMDQPTANAALGTGQVDGAFTTILSYPLREQNLIRYIDSTKGKSPDFAYHAHLLVTDDFAQKYPDIVNRVVRVGVEAAHWASDPAHRDELFQIWAKSGVSPAAFAADYDNDDLTLRLSPLFDDYLTEQYRRAAADALRLGLIRQPVDVDSWIDRKPLEKALTDLHLESFWPHFDKDGNKQVAGPEPQTEGLAK